MLQQQFIDIINKPHQIVPTQLAELEVLVNEYPFFESAHLLYTKGLHQHNAINYSKQLRKTAIVANSRTVLYELIHQEQKFIKAPVQEQTESITEPVKEVVKEIVQPEVIEQKQSLSPVTVTNDDIKVIYINTITSAPKIEEKPVIEEKAVAEVVSENKELDIVKAIENETQSDQVEESVQEMDPVEKLNKDIELEISKGIVQSYVETDILKTNKVEKEEAKEPATFTDWLNKVKREAGTIQIQPAKAEDSKTEEKEQKAQELPKIEKKSTILEQKMSIIDKSIESDPGRIKLGSQKFFTPANDAKKSLLENEHLVTETLAKIYALQGNISKAIRAYEILSLKFPQKSVYFASLIEKLKTSK